MFERTLDVTLLQGKGQQLANDTGSFLRISRRQLHQHALGVDGIAGALVGLSHGPEDPNAVAITGRLLEPFRQNLCTRDRIIGFGVEGNEELAMRVSAAAVQKIVLEFDCKIGEASQLCCHLQ